MNQLKVLNSLIKSGRPSYKLFNNLLLNSDENAAKIIKKSIAFLGIKAEKLDDINDLMTMAKSERTLWERYKSIYDMNHSPNEKTMCALMDYYINDLAMVKRIYDQMDIGVGKNLKAALDWNKTDGIGSESDYITIQREEPSKRSLIKAYIAAGDLNTAYNLLKSLPKDPTNLHLFQNFKAESPKCIEEVILLFDRAKRERYIDKYQALEPKIQHEVAKQNFVLSTYLIRKYLEGYSDKVISPKMQPIILNYYLKNNLHEKAFELFIKCDPKNQLESISHLMAELTKLCPTSSRFSAIEIFDMILFAWNIYIFLLRSGNSFKEYFKIQRTLQHTLRYFVKIENEEYSDQVLYHAINGSVKIEFNVILGYGELKLKKNGGVWTHLLLPTLAYPQPYARDDPFKDYDTVETLETSGLLPENIYENGEHLFDFPYTIKPDIEADLIETLLLLYGKSVQVDYTQGIIKLSTYRSLKSFYKELKDKNDIEVLRLLARLCVLKGYDDLIVEVLEQMYNLPKSLK